MVHCSALLMLMASGAHAGTLRGGRFALDAHMQPEVVAKTLKNVEDKWADQAYNFIHCNATAGKDCTGEPNSFGKSCAVVVGAIVQGSSGDEHNAKEYMAEICSQPLMKGWHQQHCNALKVALDTAMSADSYQNRNTFTAGKLCNTFWSQFVQEEKKRFVKEEAERVEAEKKAAEEAARKAKEAAEAEKKAKEEAEAQAKKAKEDAEKKAAAEAAQKKIEEAKRIKAEAQAKAAESAKNLAKKKAEAEEFAKKAQLKLEEAAEAEREHKSAMAHVNSTQEANSTAHANSPVTVTTKKEEEKTSIVAAVATANAADLKPKAKTVPVAKTTAVDPLAKPAVPVSDSKQAVPVAKEVPVADSKALAPTAKLSSATSEKK